MSRPNRSAYPITTKESGRAIAVKNRTRRPLRLLALLVAALAGLAALPPLAGAATITVDDDRAQCPLADFTSLGAAVAGAANGDSIRVCAGTYEVGSGAPSSGLRIEKNLEIVGAGADRVFVQPTQGGASMAQASPNPRDEYGNVITVRRRLIELFDVSISGLTVRAGDVPVEAGIAMIDVVSGSISGVRVEGIVPAGGPGTGAFEPPAALAAHGQGVIVANTMEATSNVTTISGSSIAGFNSTGLLVDNRLLDGSAPVGNGSRVTARVLGGSIVGAGGVPPVAQTGIAAVGGGARVVVAASRIAAVGAADGSAAALALRGADAAASRIGGSAVDANDLDGNAYGATNVAYDGGAATASLDASFNHWGTTVGGDSSPLVGAGVSALPTAAEPPPAPTLAPVPDAPPTVAWDEGPADGAAVRGGLPLRLAVVAGDDFGVKSVRFELEGSPIGTAPTPALDGERVYALDWTPAAAAAGPDLDLSVLVTDSADQLTTHSLSIDLEGPPRFTAAPGAIGGKSGAYAAVGRELSCGDGAPTGYPLPQVSYEWARNGVPVGSGPTYTPTPADQGKRLACGVTVANEFGSLSQTGGPVLVAFVPTIGPAELSGAAGPYALAGETLACAAAAAGDPVPVVSYSWLRDGAPIEGAVGGAYTVGVADERHELSCLATATSDGGSASSSASTPVGGAPVGGTATLEGNARVGAALTCSSGGWSALPAAEVSYLWLRDGAPIEGAVGEGYTLAPADAGTAISCRALAVNPLGSGEATSEPLSVAAAPPLLAKGGAKGSPPGAVKGARAVLATVSCEVGPCAVAIAGTVKVWIGGKAYRARVVAPLSLGSGESGQVSLLLGKKARKALRAAGRSRKLTLALSVSGGGAATSEELTVVLKAPKPKRGPRSG